MEKIIVKERRELTNYYELHYELYPTVPAGNVNFVKEQANATAIDAKSCSAELKTALKNGEVYEVDGVLSLTPAHTLSNIKNLLIAEFNAAQTKVNDSVIFQYYNYYWNGTAWLAP
jgi:hypothetical protein